MDANSLFFLFLTFSRKGEWGDEYLFAAYTFSGDGDLIVWAPNFKRFEELVAEGRLEGVTDNEELESELLLTGSADEILEILDAPENRDLFDYTEPFVFRKVVGDRWVRSLVAR